MIDPSKSAISIVVVISLIISTFLIVRSPLMSLYLLPLPMMVGPIFVLPIAGVGFITAGDLYAAIFIVRTLILRGVRLKNSGRLFLLLGIFILSFSVGLSPNLESSVVGLIRILQYALLVRASIVLIKQPSDLRNLLIAWVFITTLCAITMLWHFYNGRSYMINWMNNPLIAEDINLQRYDILFRPTFFYASIWAPLGLSVLYSLMSILMKFEPSGLKRVLLSMTIPLNFIALLMNNARAMLAPVTVLCGMIALWFCCKSLTRPEQHLREALFLLIITGVSIWYFAGLLIMESQLSAMLERSLNTGSVVTRLSVWISSLSELFDNPLRLLVGWGPQSTVRQANVKDMQLMLTDSQGNVAGAFDSTFVGLLIEYGLIFSTLVFVSIAHWFSRTWRYYKVTGDAFALVLLVMSTALVFASNFQQIGLGPPDLMALQLFVFLPILKKTASGNRNILCAASAEN